MPAPIRWVHVLWAVTVGPILAWLGNPGAPVRRQVVLPLIVGAMAVAVLWPLDAVISTWAVGLNLRGDLRRELEALQQFGQGAVSLVLAVTIVLAQPWRWRRLLDWGAAALVVGLTVNLLKFATGRPRPVVGEPDVMVGPFARYPMPKGDGFTLESVWTAGYHLASMPSRHAAFAVVAAVMIWHLFPRVRWVGVALALVVMTARIVTGAHYPSDVVAGAALGAALSIPAFKHFWGVRALDWFWIRVVDRAATPALPAVRAGEPG